MKHREPNNHRVDCQCKTDETVVVEPDGYRWSHAVEGPCNACKLAPITGRACPFHGAEMAP